MGDPQAGIVTLDETAAADLAFAPIHEPSARQRRGEISAAALTDLFLDRIARYDGKLHAFLDLYRRARRRRSRNPAHRLGL
jgi:Asp-tRNA(Asn)/Glu-tRNA(Gln) amidotransferase A subunit family amidase